MRPKDIEYDGLKHKSLCGDVVFISNDLDSGDGDRFRGLGRSPQPRHNKSALNQINEEKRQIAMEFENGMLQLVTIYYILSRASEVGSPTNPPWAPGSDKTQGQGSFGPFIQNFKKKRTVHLIRFSLRQGEPGTSQYLYYYTLRRNNSLHYIHSQ